MGMRFSMYITFFATFGESYEALLGRLVQYLRSGQSKADALKRLYESLDMVGQPANQMGKLAILTRDS